MTLQEYFRLEEASEERHEYLDGIVTAMAGGTARHSLLIMNVGAAIHGQLRGKSCRVYESSLRVKVELTELHTFPDLSIICGKPEFDPNAPADTATNPTVILEVLSDSTEAHDRGRKFHHFQQIPTLREYVLVSQDEPSVEVFRRVDGAWTYHHFAGLEAVAQLESVGVELALADVYAGAEDAA